MALAIVIIDAGGDATTLGLVLAAKMLSGTLFVLVGGVWADRMKRKHVMILADISRAALLLVLVIVSAPDLPRYWMALIVFLVGIGDAFGAPASAAIMNVIVPDHVLQQANVVRGVTGRLGGILGPAFGGVIVALVGARYTFILTAATFLIASDMKSDTGLIALSYSQLNATPIASRAGLTALSYSQVNVAARPIIIKTIILMIGSMIF